MPTAIEKVAFSRGQDHGSYTNAYKTDDVDAANLDSQARAYADDTPFDLLEQEQFDDARKVLGEGVARQPFTRTPLSNDAKTARMPPPPESLLALPDEVAHKPRRGRVAKVARAKSRETS